MSTRRALHFVFKIAYRKATIDFYRDVLGMKVLRHEEFEEGCNAACNGPYDGKWSKTMVGYGAEDDHFVVELTYNYGIKEYKLGNDFLGLTIDSSSVIPNAQQHSYNYVTSDDISCLLAPDGYKFNINTNETMKDPVKMVTLASSNLTRSVEFWHDLLKMKIYDQNEKNAVLGYSDDQCKLQLVQSSSPIDHAEAYGRIAFSCPSEELKPIETCMKENQQTILTPYISLDTPGKATVQVVIIADPEKGISQDVEVINQDGHEICFVGDEGFRELSQIDPKGDQLLNEAMEKDKSDEWYAKKTAKKINKST